MSQDFGTRPSVTFRPSATANLMIDSSDRDTNAYPSEWDFQIVKRESIMNGFFNRIATTEVVLNWCVPNINTEFGNTTMTFDLSGTGGNTHASTQTITLLDGFYTVEETLKGMVSQLNDLSGTTAMTFAIVTTGATVSIVSTGGDFTITATTLSEQLMMEQEQNALNEWYVGQCANLQPYRYIDFVSQDLTYAQYLKDSNTTSKPIDVLCRWYFADDAPEMLDGLGFPILQGYKNFCRRRIFNPPKYIRWDNNLPIGNLRFGVYADGALLPPNLGDNDSTWLMTLQVSEN